MDSLKRAMMAGFFISICAVVHAQERREAGAHEHGRGSLNIAIDGDMAGFDMRVPGADIIGFEHAARTDEQKAKLEAAKEFLGNPLKVAAPPPAADCTAGESFVHYTKDPEHAAMHQKHHGGGGHGGGNEKHGDHHEGKEHHGGHHGAHHEGHHGYQEGHAEFHLGFQLQCLSPEKLTSVTVGYFEQFPNAQSLLVRIATANGQTQKVVTRENPIIELDGKM